MVTTQRNYEPACDCYRYKNRCCSLCGKSKQTYEFEQRVKKPSKKDLIKRVEKKFGINGIVKKRTIFD